MSKKIIDGLIYYNNDIIEYRGIPANESITDIGSMVYGTLDVFNGLYTITTIDMVEVNVHNITVGERIYRNYFDGDILSHPDYPESLFEFQYHKGNYTPVIIYGSNGNIELRRFPQDITEYNICGWKYSYRWYPIIENYLCDYPVGEGLALISSEPYPGRESCSVNTYFDSQFGNLGTIQVYRRDLDDEEPRKIDEYSVKNAPEKIKNLLINRKLISEKCGHIF